MSFARQVHPGSRALPGSVDPAFAGVSRCSWSAMSFAKSMELPSIGEGSFDFALLSSHKHSIVSCQVWGEKTTC